MAGNNKTLQDLEGKGDDGSILCHYDDLLRIPKETQPTYKKGVEPFVVILLHGDVEVDGNAGPIGPMDIASTSIVGRGIATERYLLRPT